MWNSWRASLLRQLYVETKRALRRGLENPVDKAEWILENQQSAIEQLEALGFTEGEVQDVWAKTGDEYFLREKVEDVVWHTEAISQHMDANKPLVLLKESGDLHSEGATQIFIRARQRDSLFAIIASALEQLDLNIQDARIYSPGAGFTLDTFFVLDNNGEPIGNDPDRIKTIGAMLRETLSDTDATLEIMQRRTPRQMRLFSVPTRTSLAADESAGHSAVSYTHLTLPTIYSV